MQKTRLNQIIQVQPVATSENDDFETPVKY